MRQPKHAAEPIPDRFVPALRRGPYGSTPAGKRLLKTFEKKCDEADLEKGRRLARRGVVTRFQIRVGMLSAEMDGEGGKTIRVAIRTTAISDAFRDAFMKQVSGESGAAGDFLNRRLTKALMAEIGEEKLVPLADEISVSCSACPETALCRHGIAVKALFVDMLNEDALLLMRWRGFGSYAEDDLGDWPADTEPVVDLLRQLRGWTRPVRGVTTTDLNWNRMGKLPPLPEPPDDDEKAIVEQLGLPPFFPESERNLMATLRRLQEDS